MTSDREHISADPEAARGFELDARPVDVLMIGSQLAHGSVGLNAALPVYAAAGLRVAAVPTTILSVLPHYPSMHRVDLDAGWVADTLDDLAVCGALDGVRFVVVGYLATSEQVRAIARWYETWRDARAAALPRVDLLLDPTLGDVEVGFYNDPALAPVLRRELVPLATGLVPNVFELAHLTGLAVGELTGDVGDVAGEAGEALVAASGSLLREGPSWVVVTGLRPDAGRIGELVLDGVSAETRTHPYVESAAKGVGDTFTAALTAALVEGAGLADAVEAAASVTSDRLRGDVPGV